MTPEPASRRGELDLAALRAQDPTGLLEGIDRAVVWDIPLTTRFRGLTRRDGVLLRGPGGWGEVAPFWNYGSEAGAPWLAAGLAQARGAVAPPRYRDAIPVNVTVPEISGSQAGKLVATSGAGTAKVKVSGSDSAIDLARDIERLEAVRDALGRSGRIRIDANGGWELEAATRILPRLDRAAGGLEYAEQPCATVEDLAELRRKVGVPIAADESIRLSPDPMEVVRSKAADVAVVKVAPLGGVHRALDLIERLGLPAVVSSALDTSVGISAGVALASALPVLGYACGLGTVRLMRSDVAVPSAVPRDGELPVREVHVSARLLEATVADDDLTSRWQVRMTHLLGALRARREREVRDPSTAVAELPL
ncbi:o-succinylbenzoate synthase [Actinomyces bowdenii]|uniref:o-succinylbenzoate synthase n=1 Tax=Actinomyces bowdenii TaxID=131109 RepID=UPI00214BDFEA|nr:o-succinylbenzoate synthase [Actinomyces bowdenii]